MYDVVAIGELLIDFTPNGKNETGIPLFGCNPGGAPANVLAMNAILGGKTAFIGKVGKDNFGEYLRHTLENAGIDATGLVSDSVVPTTLAFVHLNEHGDRSFSFYRSPGADLMLTAREVNRDIIKNAVIFHFGSVSLTGEPCRTTVHETLQFAKDADKIISYDPNYRPLLWNGADEAKKEMLRPVPLTDILKVSEEEMELMTGETDLDKGASMLMNMGPAIVLVSLGAKGAFFRCRDGCGLLPAYNVKTIDTTGAGDAFLGAVLYRLRGKNREDLYTISAGEMRDVVDFANAAGSLTTAKKGAIPAMPQASEIEACKRNIPLL